MCFYKTVSLKVGLVGGELHLFEFLFECMKLSWLSTLNQWMSLLTADDRKKVSIAHSGR